MKCPESIEELQELEKMIPLCKITLFEQAKARIETGAAKSVSEAARQIAEETGRKSESVRSQISREGTVQGAQLSAIAGTAKHIPPTLTGVDNAIAVPERPHVVHNSGDNEWYTPQHIIDAARNVMGRIDLDPASTEEANGVVMAGAFYSAEDDGLEKNWSGNVWMNPPYSSDLIARFIDKLVGSVATGSVKNAIVLVNNATETKWFSSLATVSNALCFPFGRVKFWHPRKIGAPLQGQAIAYIGKNEQLFFDEFSKIGIVAKIIN